MSSEEYKAKNYKKALEETFVELDYMLINDEGFEKMKEIVNEIKRSDEPSKDDKEIRGIPFGAGCTSCVVLITKDKIICANSGDSRAVIGLKNGKLIELSYDHKPDNEGELKRVKEGGGFVEDGRVQGVIAVSRAIGDWEYKNPNLLKSLQAKHSKKKKSKKQEEIVEESKQTGPYRNLEESKKHQVSGFPDVKEVEITADVDFIINACDGIWDCFTNEEAIKYIRRKKEAGPRTGKMGLSPTKLKSEKSLNLGKKQGSAGLKLGSKKQSSELSSPTKKVRVKGETSFIIEDMMNQGIAKGDVSQSDGTGTDNMTCIIVYFRNPEDVEKEKSEKASQLSSKEESKQ